MDNTSMRVAVARNVLFMLNTYKYDSGHSYLVVDKNALAKSGVQPKNISDIAPYCKVCVLGALYLSIAQLTNDQQMFALVEDVGWLRLNDVRNAILKVFDEASFDTIEAVYEGLRPPFAKRYDVSKRERLEAIMINIIDNNGTCTL